MKGKTRSLLGTALGTALATILTAATAAFAAPAPAPASPAWGKLLSSDGKISYPLDKPEVVLGADAACGVVLHDASVSPQHARLTYKDGVVEIEDLGSRTGTLVAGNALKPGKTFRILQPVEVDVGAVTLHFEFGTRPALLAPTQKPGPDKKPGSGAMSKGQGSGKGKAAPKAKKPSK